MYVICFRSNIWNNSNLYLWNINPFYIVLIFIFFPVFLALVLSIIMMFVMKISKFIKNKEIFQTIITLLLVTSIFIVEYNVINNIFIQNKEIEIVENNFQIADKLIEFFNKTIIK